MANRALTYDAQGCFAAMTEALQHWVAHKTDQHISDIELLAVTRELRSVFSEIKQAWQTTTTMKRGSAKESARGHVRAKRRAGSG